MKQSVVWVAVMSDMGIAAGNRENLSIIVSRYRLPRAAGKGPTMSTWTMLNLPVAGEKTVGAGTGLGPTFAAWHLGQAWHQSLMSFLIPFHTKLSHTFRVVAFVPG